jgi:hypothetical protein
MGKNCCNSACGTDGIERLERRNICADELKKGLTEIRQAF